MHALHDQVLAFIDEAGGGGFEPLALAVFAHQFAHCEAYRRFCLSRRRTPDTVTDWRAVPPVPIQAFKHADLCCGAPVRTFLSTGTTAGPDLRSRHLVPDLRLYHRAAVAGLRTFLFPDVSHLRLVALIPPATTRPESSLAQMVAWAMETFGDAGSAYALVGDAPDFAGAVELLRAVERNGQPVCLLATTGTLIHFLDYARARDLTFRLPHGSRIMDTGGDKGAPRPLSRHGLLHACWNAFAVPGYFCVNEYGMAELSSQFYDSVIADRVAGRHRPRTKVGPHWARTLVLDPASLVPLPAGQRGLLCHIDLANAGSVMAVLTEDIGRETGHGFELLGRAAGAELRGCSLSLAEWEAA